MKKEENILGTEKLSKLLKKFAIPSIISLLVNALYNIVDQIFIGWGVGYLGNGATNIVFPLTIICLAFALAFGDGASAYLSLKLGEKKEKEASKGVGNSITLTVMIAVLFCITSIIFLPQLLNLFGCTDALRQYALNYGYIIAIGLPFMMIGTTLNSIIRADGSPKYASKSMIIGAVLNIVLDPIFIFVFKMGVEGAAIATIISQILTCVLNISYIRKMKSITLKKEDLKLKGNISKKITMLGISSFITQISIVIVIAVMNNLLRKYGADSKYGTEIPLTVLGIVMKINQILNSIIIGLAVGAQPIIGYNYGAGNYKRVKSTLKASLGISTIIGFIAFILFQTIPDQLISIFGSGDTHYMEFANQTFRIYLMLCICNGIQITSGIFFQAIGKSAKSAVLSLSRQILILIPAFFLLGKLFGLTGILYAGPVADGLAFILAGVLLLHEMKSLENNNDKIAILSENNLINRTLKDHVVITIGREYGSGGRYIGKLVADYLGMNLYDKEFLVKVSEETGFTEEFIEKNEQKRGSLQNLNNGYYTGLSNADELFLKESEIIRTLAEKESCVIIGRCADFVLKNRKDVFKVFIYNDSKNKIKRAVQFYGKNSKTAEKEIDKLNKLRAKHYKHYTEKNWNNPKNYDLCMNSDLLGVEKTAALICNAVNEFQQEKLKKSNRKH